MGSIRHNDKRSESRDMSVDTSPNNADLKAQYAKRVDADLEGNAKEQEKISSEIAALQERLRVLEGDRTLLLSMRQAISEERLPGRQRREKGDDSEGEPRSRRRASVKAKDKDKSANAVTSGRGRSATPVLRVLVAKELAKHSQPRSAAEVTSALTRAYPDRRFIDQVVRNTLENLVARGEVQRSKQQRAVFYAFIGSAKGTGAQSASTSAAV